MIQKIKKLPFRLAFVILSKPLTQTALGYCREKTKSCSVAAHGQTLVFTITVGATDFPSTALLVEVMVDRLREDATVLFDTVEMLLRERLYHSAEIAGGILLSRASMLSQQAQRDGDLHAEALSMFADALKGRGEHKRATVSHSVETDI